MSFLFAQEFLSKEGINLANFRLSEKSEYDTVLDLMKFFIHAFFGHFFQIFLLNFWVHFFKIANNMLENPFLDWFETIFQWLRAMSNKIW